MAKGNGNSEDWQCCEQCSYCFTVFVGILFFLAGGAMAVYSALFLWSNIDVSIHGLELLDVDDLQIGIFVIGLCIACTALLGMILAGCAKCAANPDGVNDCCEKCCTAVLSILYIIILSLLLAASLVIAGFLSYYAATVNSGSTSSCPYPEGSTQEFIMGADNAPDELECSIDYVVWETLIENNATFLVGTGNATWVLAQDLTFTCGYFCGVENSSGVYEPKFCSPTLGANYEPQLTGTYCNTKITATEGNPSTVYKGFTESGVPQQFVTDQFAQMSYRPTFFSVINTYLIPLLAVWWCIFVFALLLIVAACVMCIRKRKTDKRSKYDPKSAV